VYGKEVRDLERTVTGVHCEAGMEGERKEEGGHLSKGVDCKSCKCEGVDGIGLGRRRESRGMAGVEEEVDRRDERAD
jgi:hypothetical protein